MPTEQRTQFDYLLNAVDRAAQEDNPAQHGYADKRRALFAYVRSLEKAAARYRWLRDGDVSAKYPYPVMRMGGDGLRDRTIWDEDLDAAIDAAMEQQHAQEQEGAKE